MLLTLGKGFKHKKAKNFVLPVVKDINNIWGNDARDGILYSYQGAHSEN